MPESPMQPVDERGPNAVNAILMLRAVRRRARAALVPAAAAPEGAPVPTVGAAPHPGVDTLLAKALTPSAASSPAGLDAADPVPTVAGMLGVAESTVRGLRDGDVRADELAPPVLARVGVLLGLTWDEFVAALDASHPRSAASGADTVARPLGPTRRPPDQARETLRRYWAALSGPPVGVSAAGNGEAEAGA